MHKAKGDRIEDERQGCVGSGGCGAVKMETTVFEQ